MVYLNHKEQENLLAIFDVTKIPRSCAHQLVKQLVKWETERGIMFVVDRLKGYVNFVLGRPQDTKISLRKKDGTPKGCFGFVCRRAAYSRRTLVQVLRTLRIYQRWEAKLGDAEIRSKFTQYQVDIAPKES